MYSVLVTIIVAPSTTTRTAKFVNILVAHSLKREFLDIISIIINVSSQVHVVISFINVVFGDLHYIAIIKLHKHVI